MVDDDALSEPALLAVKSVGSELANGAAMRPRKLVDPVE